MNKRFFSFLLVAATFFSIFSTELYKKDAVVSFYAEDFHGKKTSNGETFNMYALTCASKTLPFDTILKITNPENGKTVEVRVNDRGPFVAGRELDLSKEAAKRLGMIKQGTAHVKIEIVKMGPDTKLSRETAAKAQQIMAKKTGNSSSVAKITPKPAYSTTPAVTPSGGTRKIFDDGKLWEIQVSAYTSKENAVTAAKRLLKQGFKNVILQRTEKVYRVVIKDIPSNQLGKIKNQLEEKGYSNYVVRERKL
ncbi:MAG: septal ring lytic transglycosylase RlpA family protein [Treponema sp.]|nr:septal ring lytic transglycosylase RlpA family protein [Treponema sp.]